MKAELKRLHTPDADDLRSFAPATHGHFALVVQAMVGPVGDDGEESFDFVVCTPAWLSEKVEAMGPLLGRHHLVMASYDYDELERFVREFCEQCDGTTWEEVATKVGQLGHWEFEDYREYEPSRQSEPL
jgi:hypothetical protein